MARTLRQAVVPLLVLGLSAGCGDGLLGHVPGQGERAGYTKCGDGIFEATCQPGQYCEDAAFGRCGAGCLGEDNCSADQDCIKASGGAVGACATVTPDDPVARCKAVCLTLVNCGLLNPGADPDLDWCRSDCDTPSTREPFLECMGTWTCAKPVPLCSEQECGPNYPCAQGSCSLMHSCF